MIKRSVLIVSMALAAGCGPEEKKGEEEVEYPPIDVAGRVCPPDSIASWENTGAPFLYSNCTGCHSSELPDGQRQNAPVGVDFDGYFNTRMWATRIFYRANSDVSGMPPSVSLPPEVRPNRDDLADWLACGAPTEEDLAEQQD